MRHQERTLSLAVLVMPLLVHCHRALFAGPLRAVLDQLVDEKFARLVGRAHQWPAGRRKSLASALVLRRA